MPFWNKAVKGIGKKTQTEPVTGGPVERRRRNPKKTQAGLVTRIRDFFERSKVPNEIFAQIEDLLIEADLGYDTSMEIIKKLRSSTIPPQKEDITETLRQILESKLSAMDNKPSEERNNFYLVMGVNGVGKTTAISKMVHEFSSLGRKDIVLAAADTFRAAAIEQLAIHASRHNVRLVKQDYGADPAAVIHDAIVSARFQGEKIIIADTAGRMHTRTDLIEQLTKINRITTRTMESNTLYRKLLVIDATTGQNALSQAEAFHEAIGVDAMILSKYDSTAKGGLLVSICDKLNIPVAYLGCGEQMEDLMPFDVAWYVDGILADV